MHLRKPKVHCTTEKPRKTVQCFQIKQDVSCGTNFKSFKEEQPVSSAVNFSESLTSYSSQARCLWMMGIIYVTMLVVI